jgi:hypothetical protein
VIGYYVPHRIHPAGYHCDPRQPLPFAGLASQKGYMSLYLMCLYCSGTLKDRFEREWKKAGKKLDMGKCCVRFKRVEDLALDVIGETIRGVTAKGYAAGVVAAVANSAHERAGSRGSPGRRKKVARRAAR